MFFWMSKILWMLVDPGNLVLLALALGTGLLWTRWSRFGRRLLVGATLAAVVVAVVPFAEWGWGVLESRFPRPSALPERVEGIIVLGGIVDPVQTRARGEEAIGGAMERLVAFARLAQRYPEAKLVFTGGSGDPWNQEFKEGHAVGPLLAMLGVAPYRVLFEAESRNTYENAVFSRRLVEPEAGERWLLVTSAFHMPRAVGCFRQAGWPVIAYPTDFNTAVQQAGFRLRFNVTGGFASLSGLLHEGAGLLFYRLTGRTDAFFPAPSDG